MWGGQGAKPAKKQPEQMKPSNQRKPRKDDSLDHVIISESENRKIKKHLVSLTTTHHPHTSPFTLTHTLLTHHHPHRSYTSPLTQPHTRQPLSTSQCMSMCTCTIHALHPLPTGQPAAVALLHSRAVQQEPLCSGGQAVELGGYVPADDLPPGGQRGRQGHPSAEDDRGCGGLLAEGKRQDRGEGEGREGETRQWRGQEKSKTNS